MNPNEDTSKISVSGDVVLVRKPDIAYVALFVSADGVLLEDAVRESATKADQVQRALCDAFSEIRDIQIQDLHVGEGRPAGFVRDKANPPRPEVIKSLMVLIPAKPDLAIKIVDTASRMGSAMANPSGFPGIPSFHSVILYGLSEPAEAEQEAIARAIADAKDKAARLAKMMEKKVGSIKSVSTMDHLMTVGVPGDVVKWTKNKLRLSAKYLSVSPDGVEVRAKISVTFELRD